MSSGHRGLGTLLCGRLFKKWCRSQISIEGYDHSNKVAILLRKMDPMLGLDKTAHTPRDDLDMRGSAENKSG